MRNGTDPSWHRAREREFLDHAEKLLQDDRLRLETMRGRKPVTLMLRKVTKADRGGDLKRMMSEMGKRDRELQDRMPIGESIDVELLHKWLWVLKSTVGRLRVISIPPTSDLLRDKAPKPLDIQNYGALVNVPARPGHSPVPETVVIFSSSGFAPDMLEMSRAPGSHLILVEPNDSGGFNVSASLGLNDIAGLFDPEQEQQKRQRVTDAIAAQAGDLTGSGIAVDRLAKQTELPMQLVEGALKSYAREHAGLVAKKLDGRLVLFRESSTGTGETAGGPSMPMIDRIRALFGGRGENEKKIAFLSERRTALSQQRDRAYEEISTLEGKDGGLREQFQKSTNELVKRRVTSQLLQLRKDMERRQQLLGVLNQQINVVSTHLHNLELVQQGSTAKLPNSEEMADDAAKAEEMLADLEASGDLASSVSAIGTMGMNDEEQALYDELQQETGGAQTAKEPAPGSSIAGASQTATGKTQLPPLPPLSERDREKKRTEPEAG